MGLGKTVSTLTAILQLQDTFESIGALVVAPLRVARLTWPDEIAKWKHTSGLRFSLVVGNEKKRRAALATPADVYLTNYENIIWLTAWFEEEERAKRKLPFDMIVWDESSKMKSHSVRRFKLFKPHREKFTRAVTLTGTPAPQNYADLFSQFYLLDGGTRLGKYITHFKREHYEQNPWNRYEEKLRDGHDVIIEKKVSDLTLVLRADDHLKMPALIHNNIEVELSSEQRDQYKKLEKEMFVELDAGDVEAFNTAALTNKCRQYTSGAMYAQDELGGEVRKNGKRVWHDIHSLKLDALADIIEDAQGSSIIVAYDFKHELERLRKRWPKAKLLGSGVPAAEEALTVRQWNDRAVPLLFAHPASVGHGLNLQHGGHILVWLGLTYSLELYLQMEKRLHRSGQLRPVIVHHILARKTIDQAVLASVNRKGNAQDNLMAAIMAYRAGV